MTCKTACSCMRRQQLSVPSIHFLSPSLILLCFMLDDVECKCQARDVTINDLSNSVDKIVKIRSLIVDSTILG
jgi:hypothetical protein